MARINKYSVNNQFSISKKQLRNLNLFWLGFIIYTIGYTLNSSIHISDKITLLFQGIGLILVFASTINLLHFKIENEYLRIVYFLYWLWVFILIIRGLDSLTNYESIRYFFLNPGYGGLLYFVPVILLFPKNPVFYKKVFDAIVVLGISYIIFDILFIKYLLSSDRQSIVSQGVVEDLSRLSMPIGFILLTYSYHSNKRKLLSIIVILLTLFFAIIRARRGLIAVSLGIILSSYIFFLFNSKIKLLIIYLSLLVISLGALYVSGIFKINNNRLFGFVAERGDEDTRASVVQYFYADMKTKDWIIGKGINGEYFCPYIEEDAVTNYRSVIETGYLQITLKGGLINLGLILLIAIPAGILGIFYSKNILSKAAGIWIIISLLSLYPFVVVAFNLSYILVWVSIGICYSKKIRNLQEDTVKEYFQ